jgi:hypothetical protein
VELVLRVKQHPMLRFDDGDAEMVPDFVVDSYAGGMLINEARPVHSWGSDPPHSQAGELPLQRILVFFLKQNIARFYLTCH